MATVTYRTLADVDRSAIPGTAHHPRLALRQPCGINYRRARHARSARLVAPLLAALAAACSNPTPSAYQGYVEGEFVNVASPIAGRLDELSVKRGDSVAVNAPSVCPRSGQRNRRAAPSPGAGEGGRSAARRPPRRAPPPEQDVTTAQLTQADIELNRTATNLARDEAQFKIGGIARAQFDDARSAHAAAQARVTQLRSELPSRNCRAATSRSRRRRRKSRPRVPRSSRRRGSSTRNRFARPRRDGFRHAPSRGRVGGGRQPGRAHAAASNVKVRFFVPQTIVGSLATGRAVAIQCDGCGADIPATISYVSNEAEFTPPVIYSNETRSKLVFMIEARPSPESATKLHPGQPVSVSLK